MRQSERQARASCAQWERVESKRGEKRKITGQLWERVKGRE